MRRPFALGLLIFLGLAGSLGLLTGLRVAALDESVLIDRVGSAWVAAGGRVEECTARPGVGRVWIVVTCGTGAGAMVRAFNRLGVPVTPVAGSGA